MVNHAILVLAVGSKRTFRILRYVLVTAWNKLQSHLRINPDVNEDHLSACGNGERFNDMIAFALYLNEYVMLVLLKRNKHFYSAEARGLNVWWLWKLILAHEIDICLSFPRFHYLYWPNPPPKYISKTFAQRPPRRLSFIICGFVNARHTFVTIHKRVFKAERRGQSICTITLLLLHIGTSRVQILTGFRTFSRSRWLVRV